MSLWLPPTVNEERAAFRCEVCGMEFPETQRHTWQRHVGKCARENIAELKELSLAERIPIMGSWDPELEEHMREVGRRMIREGRLTVRKNERAGFS